MKPRTRRGLMRFLRSVSFGLNRAVSIQQEGSGGVVDG
jgi:hypothetical protein